MLLSAPLIITTVANDGLCADAERAPADPARRDIVFAPPRPGTWSEPARIPLDSVGESRHACGMPSWNDSKGSIEALNRYWSSRAGGLAPQRNDIDPADIKPLLPYLYIVRYERDPFRVHYMLTGTEADRWNGFNLTGRYVDEFLGTDINGANRTLLDAYAKAFDTAAPVFGAYKWPTRAGYMLEVRFGMFPLRVGEQIQQCLAIEDYSGFSPAMAADSVPFENITAKRADITQT